MRRQDSPESLPQKLPEDAVLGSRSQSEVIGVVLLTGVVVVAVSLFTVVAVSNFTNQATAQKQIADFKLEITTDNLTVSHNGGDVLSESGIEVIVRTASGEQQYQLSSDSFSKETDGDTQFEPGESAVFAHGLTGRATVLVVDTDNGAILKRQELSIPVDTTQDPANFAVRIDNTNSPVTEGETLVVRPTITNTGDEQATQNTELTVSGEGVVDSRSLTLDGGESEQIPLEWATEVGDSGEYDATVSSANDSATEPVTVRSKSNFEVSIDDTNSPIREGENLSVTTTVQNTGGSPDVQNILLNVSGQSNPVDFEEVALDGGESRQLTLEWPTATGDNGSYDVTVTSEDASTTQSVTVQANEGPSVTVKDPNGGEVLTGGSESIINWTASDDGSGIDPDSVDIAYSTDGGSSYTNIVTNTTNDGSYTWTVPDVDGSDSVVRVSVDDNSSNTGRDTSNETFTIDSSPPTIDTFTDLSASKDTDNVTIGSLSISDNASGLSSVDIVVRDPDGNIIGTDNSSNLGGASTFSATDLQVSTSGIQPNKQYTVTVVATDGVGKETSASDTTTTSGAVADANGPYTVDEGGSVTLDGSGSNPQTGNPDYTWSILSGGPGSISDANSQSATYNAPANVDSDTNVTVQLAIEEQGTTYTDTGTVTIRNVSKENDEWSSPSGFSGNPSASDMPRGTNSATQTFNFTPNKTLSDGESVTVNLNDVQGIKVTGQNENPDPVDYQPASVNIGGSNLDGGSASLDASQDDASITYTANGDVSAGTTIDIQVSGVETQNGNAGTLQVTFSRSDGVSETTTFTLN
ncbi:type IV pilin [Salinibaculum salinum]|uniref:type IV pilin n=1 Tax=Salinibaculum salinum TaxID=3131996 RepID=UPI0030EB17DC